MNDELIKRVAAHIARYLQENRAAADTVEGVHYVWVGADVARCSLDVTQAALESLLERGAIGCLPIGNRVLWRAVRERTGD